MEAGLAGKTKPRLKFIDLARSIAILLMLEGHFISMTLAEGLYDVSDPVYYLWNSVRGFTAPLFFTVAGMIFVFLLTGEREQDFFRRVRVRKGLKRSGELLFWGYALQFSFQNIPHYLEGYVEWLCAFHVLQCLGAGLLFLILIAGCAEKLRVIPLMLWYVAATAGFLVLDLCLNSYPPGTRLPHGWPILIQNAFRGPDSQFPISPWLCFAFLGGAMGAYVRNTIRHQVTLRSNLWYFVLAIAFLGLWFATHRCPFSARMIEGLSWFTSKACGVVLFLGILRLIEVKWGIGVPWLLRVGRETFSIYILHSVILYGSLIGIGLNHWLTGRLNWWQAILGAVIFVAFFAAYAIAFSLWKQRKTASMSENPHGG